MTDDLDVEDTTAETLPAEDFEQALSERRFEDTVQQAEIVDWEPMRVHDDQGQRKVLQLAYRTVSGMELVDAVPFPEEYDPSRSDLVTVLEFVDGDPSDLSSLSGTRVPSKGGEVQYGVMRRVLSAEEAAVGEWDLEKRLQKASDQQ